MTRALRAFVLGLALLASSVARAEWEPSGALTTSALVRSGSIGGEAAYGGGFLVEVWHAASALRLGVATGVAILGGDTDVARTVTPFGASLAIVLRPRPIGFHVGLRAGFWGGATHVQGFAAGGFLSAAAHLQVRLSSRAAIGVGCDLHFLLGRSDVTLFAPGLVFVFGPEE